MQIYGTPLQGAGPAYPAGCESRIGDGKGKPVGGEASQTMAYGTVLRQGMRFGAGKDEFSPFPKMRLPMVPLARLERALPKKLDFESSASTNSATGAARRRALAGHRLRFKHRLHV